MLPDTSMTCCHLGQLYVATNVNILLPEGVNYELTHNLTALQGAWATRPAVPGREEGPTPEIPTAKDRIDQNGR